MRSNVVIHEAKSKTSAKRTLGVHAVVDGLLAAKLRPGGKGMCEEKDERRGMCVCVVCVQLCERALGYLEHLHRSCLLMRSSAREIFNA